MSRVWEFVQHSFGQIAEERTGFQCDRGYVTHFSWERLGNVGRGGMAKFGEGQQSRHDELSLLDEVDIEVSITGSANVHVWFEHHEYTASEFHVTEFEENFMTSYRMVFDRENLKLGWSPSDCYQLDENEGAGTPAPSPQNVLKSPTPVEQQQTSPARAVSPAIAGRTPRLQHSDSVQRKSDVLTCVLFSISVIAFSLFGRLHGITTSDSSF
eukprot:Gb_20915 [translate_table: standard]